MMCQFQSIPAVRSSSVTKNMRGRYHTISGYQHVTAVESSYCISDTKLSNNPSYLALIVKGTHNVQEEIDMRPFVDKKPHWVPLDGHLENEIWGCSWLQSLPAI